MILKNNIDADKPIFIDDVEADGLESSLSVADIKKRGIPEETIE